MLFLMFLQVLSVSYSMDSEFAFPDVEEERGLGGYSRVFRAGFRNVVR